MTVHAGFCSLRAAAFENPDCLRNRSLSVVGNGADNHSLHPIRDYEAVLENLGNIGDFVGGVAVVFTLIYLALQVRQNSAIVRANARAQTNQALSEFRQFIASDPNTLRIHHASAEEFEELPPDEQRQYLYLLGYMFRSGEFIYGQYVDGLVSESAWIRQQEALANALSRVHIAAFWEIRKRDYDPDFVATVDKAAWTARETPDETVGLMIERIQAARSATPDLTG